MPVRSALPLPPPLRGADPDSFARYTVAKRLPGIARRVLDENAFPASVRGRLETLINELRDGTVRPLNDRTAPDTADWDAYLAPHKQATWFDVPWYFAEAYFYRRILEATGYFRDGPTAGIDPFLYQKYLSLSQHLAGVDRLARRSEALREEESPRAYLNELLRATLWGNQADLSMWAAGEAEGPRGHDDERAHTHLLSDQISDALDHLDALDAPRVDLIVDNAGYELCCDLCLADALLGTGRAERVVFHLKTHPTFVSDTTLADVHATLARLAAVDEPAVRRLVDRLRAFTAEGKWILTAHPFWTAPLGFRVLPNDLHAVLGDAGLVVSKGDANYRRFLGDRHWPYDTPFESIVTYFPAPLLALRTLKSEVAAGIPAERLERLYQEDPDWRVNGEWAVAQFVPLQA